MKGRPQHRDEASPTATPQKVVVFIFKNEYAEISLKPTRNSNPTLIPVYVATT